MGFDVLLPGYISMERGGAQHGVTHADRVFVCVTKLHMGGCWNRCLERLLGRAEL